MFLFLFLSVIIHSFTSHAGLLFEYECTVRGVITALDHSPDAAATHFSSSVQCANIPWHPDILMLRAPSTPQVTRFPASVSSRVVVIVRSRLILVSSSLRASFRDPVRV